MSFRDVYGDGDDWPPVRCCTRCSWEDVLADATHMVQAPDGLQSFACAAHARKLAWEELYDVEPIAVFFDNVVLVHAFDDLRWHHAVAMDSFRRLQSA